MCLAITEPVHPQVTRGPSAVRFALLLVLSSFGCAHRSEASGATARIAASPRGSRAQQHAANHAEVARPQQPSARSAPRSKCSAGKADEPLARSAPTILDAYRREGGAWLDSLPLLVNEEFDMGLAMSLEGGLGAGLAAAQRREHNLRKAQALDGVLLEAAAEERLATLRCCGLDVYFLLWGRDEASLQMIVDVAADARASRIVSGPQLSLGSATSARELTRATSMLLQGVACSESS